MQKLKKESKVAAAAKGKSSYDQEFLLKNREELQGDSEIEINGAMRRMMTLKKSHWLVTCDEQYKQLS